MTLKARGLVAFQATRAHGSLGLRMEPSRPPPRCQCYDMCTAPLFSLTTRALHLPGWPGLIKKAWFTCWGSDRPPSPLPVALTLHFLWARPLQSRVINNHRMEWGKGQFPIQCTPRRETPFILSFCLSTLNVTWRIRKVRENLHFSARWEDSWNVLSVLLSSVYHIFSSDVKRRMCTLL